MTRRVLTAVLMSLFLAVTTVGFAAPLQGWRTDGTGRYPDATPPTSWAPDQGVAWSTALPGPGNSTPLLVGDRMFFGAEPSTLVCVSAADGSILWHKPNELLDLVDAAEAEKLREAQKKGAEARGQLGQAYGEVRKLKQQLQDKPDDADLKTKLAETEQRIKDLAAVVGAYGQEWYAVPDVHPVNGYATPTPVSDGVRVFTWYGTGLAVAYDFYGTRLWQRVLGKPTIGWGACMSPLLVGDKLIIQSRETYALNKDTGEIIWHKSLPETWATPQPATVGGVDVFVTGAGDVVRVSDGALLAEKLAVCTFGSPVVIGDIAYFIENGGKAVRLKEIVDDKLVTEVLWTTQPKNERYYAAPVVQDGLIYCVMQHGVFSVIDAADGKVVYEKDLGLGKGTVYPSVTAAGAFIYVSMDNGTTVVLKPGREHVEVARNTLEPFRSCPVFVGNRLYIRGQQKLYCIGG